MSRSKKKTVSQQMVNVATTGMPSPLRKTLGSRIGASLIVLSIPVVLYTGLVSVSWENGRPRLSFNRQKAAEVKEETADKLQEFREDFDGDSKNRPIFSEFGSRDNSNAGFTVRRQQDEGPRGVLAEQAEDVKEWLGSEAKPEEPKGPFSKMKQRFQRR